MTIDLSREYRRLQSQPTALSLATEWFVEQARFADRATFLATVLPRIAQSMSARFVAVARPRVGQWHTDAHWGTTRPLPVRLLADCLDAEQPRVHDTWIAAPLTTQGPRSSLLVAELSAAKTDAPWLLDALAASLAIALHEIEQRHAHTLRLQRLEAILEIAAQWNQNLQMDSLLKQMAEASTRLLGAERASIFLWDRGQHLLIGRPALGVEGGELRVPDHAGIVGQVVQTGEPRRVNQGTNQTAIHRAVDEKLGFHTRSLLCVPLRGRKGQVLGAFEMINKREGDFTDDDEAGLIELAAHATIAIENSQQVGQLLQSRQRVTQQAAASVQLIGDGLAMNRLRQTVARVATTELAILILGENGTGKEVVSRMVHYLSERRDEPFVAVNCAAIAETLLESELFGHEKGAFTDAHEARPGKFELATGGTLFLDEIGDMSLSGQAKLLRVLEEKVVVRVGGSRTIATDARVIAATNQDLAELVRQRRFREDLFFRLNVVALTIPPLRERPEDVVQLAHYFLTEFAGRARRKVPQLTSAAEKRLRLHPWPGNVRELRNLMERLAYLTPTDTIDAADLEFIIAPKRDELSAFALSLGLAEATRLFQTEYIRKHIAAADNNMSDAARNLGLHRSNLYRKMRQLEMKEGDDEPVEDGHDDGSVTD